MKLDKARLFADCNYEPHPGQLAVHQSTAPRRILIAGTRFGKSTCACMEAIAAALEPAERSIGWVCAPTYDLCDRVFTQIQLVAARFLSHRIIAMKDAERRILFRNMAGGTSELRAKSCDNPVSLLGEGLDFLILDEAARVKPVIWNSHLSQRLIDKKGRALLISTPRGRGWLWDLFMRGQNGIDPDFESWRFPSSANPYLDAAIIEAERSRIPEQSFLEQYEAEFIEGSGAVFRHVREAATGEYWDAEPDAEYVGGLDLARVNDWSVIVIMNCKREVVWLDRWQKLDWSLQVARIQAAAKEYNDCRILVDSTGSGEPIFERLREAGVQAQAYPFTASSKSQLISNLALMLEQEEIVLPRPDVCPELVEELEAFQYSITDSGNVRTGAPSGMHDDTVIASALAAWLAKELSGHGLLFEVFVGDEAPPNPPPYGEYF